MATSCPVCGNKENFLEKRLFEKFTLLECPRCSVGFWSPLQYPGKEFYETSYMFDIVEKREPAWYHRQFLDNPPVSRGKLLDIGCGQGEFLAAISKNKNFEVWGIDIAQKNIDFIKQEYGIKNVFNETLDFFSKRSDVPKFDVVTSFEVLEHMIDPVSFITVARSLLAPNGYLILSTPNSSRFGGAKEDWDYPPNHLFHWNKKSLTMLLEACRLSPKKIIEEPFSKDFFYIRGTFSFGIVRRFRSKTSGVAPKKGGLATGGGPRSENGSLATATFLAKLKNGILSPLTALISIILRSCGVKYWDIYLVAQPK